MLSINPDEFPSQAHTTLYRFFGESSELLYVGIANNLGRRIIGHISGKKWWTEVIDIRLQTYPSRDEALVAETTAILAERPKYNKTFRTAEADGGSEGKVSSIHRGNWRRAAEPLLLPDHPNMHQPEWLWEGYHCTLHKELMRDYGVTCEVYWTLYKEQDGKCALCKRPVRERRLVFDYSEITFEVRGLLCKPCRGLATSDVGVYLSNPPGVGQDFEVSEARVQIREARLEAKRRNGANLRGDRKVVVGPKIPVKRRKSAWRNSDPACPHGTVTAYHRPWNCRCDKCYEVHARYNAEWYRRHGPSASPSATEVV